MNIKRSSNSVFMTQRIIFQNQYPYFITTNIKNGYYLFKNEKYAYLLSGIILSVATLKDTNLLSYIIMPNHVHLLINVNLRYDISSFMLSIKGNFSYTAGLGRIWQPRYNYRIIDNKKRLENGMIYIRNNPIKARLAIKYQKLPYYFIDKNKTIKLLQ